MTNITLFLLFAKFGALCFGGGYMIIPLLYHAFVEVDPVFTLEAFGNLLSLSHRVRSALTRQHISGLSKTASSVRFLRQSAL